MSDISLHFSLIDLLIAIPRFGWPGALVGAVLGALIARDRGQRGLVMGAAIGALLGCVVYFAARFAILFL